MTNARVLLFYCIVILANKPWDLAGKSYFIATNKSEKSLDLRSFIWDYFKHRDNDSIPESAYVRE
jgi:hypothetical protein